MKKNKDREITLRIASYLDKCKTGSSSKKMCLQCNENVKFEIS